jgi:hypothetical protein
MDNLNKLAAREREKLIRQAMTSGTVPKEDLDALERLEKLSGGKSTSRQLWIPACAFLIPLAIVTFLIAKRQSETQIDLNVTVSAFSVILPQKQPLFDGSLLSSLQATSLAGVDDLAAGDGDCSIDVKLGPSPRTEEAINLQLLEVPPGDRVRIEQSEPAISVSMIGSGAADAAATVSVRGRATVVTVCGGVRTLREVKPDDMPSMSLQLGPRSNLSLTPLPSHPLQFAPQIPIQNLALISEERYFTDAAEVRQLSSVLTGTLYLNALNGKAIPLRPSETLAFEALSGTLRRISLDARGMQLQLTATVQGMTTGEPPNKRSLMPNELERISTSNELWLWWGSAASAFAVLMSVLRWLKVTS